MQRSDNFDWTHCSYYLFSVPPNVLILLVLLLIHLANFKLSYLMKIYFRLLSCRDKRSIITTDELLGKHKGCSTSFKMFMVTYPNDMSHRSRKRHFEGIQITVLCNTNLILLFCHQGPVFFCSSYWLLFFVEAVTRSLRKKMVFWKF